MASSDVDQKFLGRLARDTEDDHPFLASMLFKVLGLSVLLSKKLVRARRLRRLDTTRDTKSLQLYHRIIWLSREGLVITEQYILPMADDKYPELKVLATKLRASFYHIFVLFHNQPSINQASIPSYRGTTFGKQASLQTSPDSLKGGPVQPALPPGLTPISVPKPSGTFLLPAVDYIPTASSCFADAGALAQQLLPGSHPLRASVKVEYAAYLYDCLHDAEGSRGLAKSSLQDVYMDERGMDDDMFEETAKLVVILDKMARRGLHVNQTSSGSGGRGSANTTPSTPRAPYATGAHPSMPSPASQRSPETKRTPDSKRTPESKRSPDSRRTSGSKRTPEERQTPSDRRVTSERGASADIRTSAGRRSPTEGRSSPRPSSEKRNLVAEGSSAGRRSPGEGRSSKRPTSDRRSPIDERSLAERRSPPEGRSSRRPPSEKRIPVEARSPPKRSSSDKGRPAEERGSKESSRDQRSPTRERSSKRSSSDKHSPTEERSSKRSTNEKRSNGDKRAAKNNVRR